MFVILVQNTAARFVTRNGAFLLNFGKDNEDSRDFFELLIYNFKCIVILKGFIYSLHDTDTETEFQRH